MTEILIGFCLACGGVEIERWGSIFKCRRCRIEVPPSSVDRPQED